MFNNYSWLSHYLIPFKQKFRCRDLSSCFIGVEAGLCVRVTYTDLQPPQAIRPQGFGISELQQASGQVGPQVVQVGVHGVGPPPEIQVVGEVEPILMHVIIRYLNTKKKESFTSMPPEKEEGKLHNIRVT